jgi:membrane carboxypeptidase/penicillin-binding protein PbpC
LQAIAEEEINNQVAVLAGRNVTNGALVAMDAENGQILAMVGSRDFRDEAIDGQVNMAISPRQPGSTMKPLTYLGCL